MISIKKETFKPVLLTFSKKNLDVANILEEISKDGTKKTDYICEAVRFYFAHGKSQNQIPAADFNFEERFKELFDKYMQIYLSENSITKNTLLDLSGISKTDLADD